MTSPMDDPRVWEAMTTEQKRAWLSDHDMVIYGGHFVAAEYYAADPAGVRKAIDAKLTRALFGGDL